MTGTASITEPVPNQRVLTVGLPDYAHCNNAVTTSKYTWWTFFPVAVGEQFRRKGNVYFLVMGCMMAIGWYGAYFDSSISPWTTLGPLALVIGISITQEGISDLARHRSDYQSNKHPCTVLSHDEQRHNHSSSSPPPPTQSKKGAKTAKNDFTKTVKIKPAGAKEESSVNIEFHTVQRRDIHVGQLILIKNREMIPCDLVLLASSNENGGAYIETSGIDGETNLKLRNSAKPSVVALKASANNSRTSSSVVTTSKRKYFQRETPKVPENPNEDQDSPEKKTLEERSSDVSPRSNGASSLSFEDKQVAVHHKPPVHPTSPRASSLKTDAKFAVPKIQNANKGINNTHQLETLEEATARIAQWTVLGFPNGKAASFLADVPLPPPEARTPNVQASPGLFRDKLEHIRRISHEQFESAKNLLGNIGNVLSTPLHTRNDSVAPPDVPLVNYVAEIACEPPNASVHTFNGKLTLPPAAEGDTQHPIEVSLNAENFLLRGAFLRNTEWAIGVACYTGKDTKLVKNSSAAPSRLSQLDQLVNRTIMIIIAVMMFFVLALSIGAVIVTNKDFSNIWYLGYSTSANSPWPYLPDLDPPQWNPKAMNLIQNMFLFITLLNNFVPLSLYVTMEMVTRALMIFINIDVNMYHAETDTPANARSTIVTDLGQIKYIFSDKTGTLTQNVMKFKRCSVDGILFGSPVVKAAPTENHDNIGMQGGVEVETVKSFHPLKKLLSLCAGIPEPKADMHGAMSPASGSKFLTFNTEMFLRVMSICHTVVVEKDYSAEADDGAALKSGRSWLGKKSKKSKHDKESKAKNNSTAPEIIECFSNDVEVDGMSKDGAPLGQSYQAESPDEGALVSAASLLYGFQLLSRSGSGLRIACSSPSLLQSEKVSKKLKSGMLTAKQFASISASEKWDGFIGKDVSNAYRSDDDSDDGTFSRGVRVETWQVLAVNKFDSTRKRMSVLVRSPEELGGVLMLLCKGADSAMLDPTVCDLGDDEGPTLRKVDSKDDFAEVSTLHLNAHLGEFASEGLRTLVLGVRLISETYGADWLARHAAASSSMANREKKLVDAALEIERELHIVGLTAIEDKLQKGVPETISKLAKAGIKLYVLTGDKRETAIEIGYSTKVLTPDMSLFQVAADGDHGQGNNSSLSVAERVRTLVASEFLRLVKNGELPKYQKKTLDAQSGELKQDMRKFKDLFCTTWNFLGCIFSWLFCFPCKLCSSKKSILQTDDAGTNTQSKQSIVYDDVVERRKAVRKYAEDIISQYFEKRQLSPKLKAKKDVGDVDDSEVILDAQIRSPEVFDRAASASAMLREKYVKGPTSVSLRSLSLASVGSKEHLANEDVLSLQSFFLVENSDSTEKKRTILERLFAVDSDVRHGRLRKHSELTKNDLDIIGVSNEIADDQRLEGFETVVEGEDSKATKHIPIVIEPTHAPKQRALIIEGAALTHLMGSPLQDEMLFAVASCFDSVIACRVSPKQKALLVRTVRTYVEPEPITLAIGDGANDVGMIQEAHVGVGISGLEGCQAVNSSDFAIAQFRFLEDLLLIHGRYNFNRMARVVLYSFYKNAVLALLLVVYSIQNLFSGTTLFDSWLISMFNFVCFFPIFFVGLFDRDVKQNYVRRNPQLYAAGHHAEEMSMRKVMRWVATTLMHLVIIYYLAIPVLSRNGGTMSSAFSGLLFNQNKWGPGDGEGDYQSDGTAIYTVLVVTLAYKALYETKSIYSGGCPTCYCGLVPNKEPFWSRLAWTWLGVSVGSIFFFIAATYLYQYIALYSATYYGFIGVATHTYQTKSLVWLVIFFVPITAEFVDVAVKVFGNMYFPTQTQIHMEIAQLEKSKASKLVLPSFQIASAILPVSHHTPGTQPTEAL